MKQTLILAIETSCDETSVAVIENGETIRSNIVASQVRSHMRFGGVVPEVASRHHTEQITQVIELALAEADCSLEQMDAIAVTQGPGLVGALLVGITAAKALAQVAQKPLISVNHIAGHIYAAQLVEPLQFPLLALVVSGGHTELIYMRSHLDFEVLGETQDDAVGEAYDKVGRVLDLPYPAGKYLDQLAQEGDATAYDIPRAMIHDGTLNFSFSGMKSAVMNIVHNANQRQEEIRPANLAASFQQAIVDIIIDKVRTAVDQHSDIKQFVLAGGVAANSAIRQALKQLFEKEYPSIHLIIPPLNLCGDNAAMIGAAGHHQFLQEDYAPFIMNAKPGLML